MIWLSIVVFACEWLIAVITLGMIAVEWVSLVGRCVDILVMTLKIGGSGDDGLFVRAVVHEIFFKISRKATIATCRCL